MAFEVGDVMRPKSGSPPVTVDENGEVRVTWVPVHTAVVIFQSIELDHGTVYSSEKLGFVTWNQ